MFNNTLRGEGTIVLKKKDVSVKLNMNAFRIMTQEFGIKLEALEAFMGGNQFDAICTLAYCGVKAAEASKGKTFKLDYELFCAQFLDVDENLQVVTDLITGSTTGEEEGDSGNA